MGTNLYHSSNSSIRLSWSERAMEDIRAALSRTKLAFRDILVLILDRVPFTFLDRARHVYFALSPGLQRHLLGLCMSIFRYRKIEGYETFAVDNRASPFRLVNCSNVIVQRLFWQGEGGFERGEPQVWRRLCQRASRIVELGANIGYYTIIGSQAAPQVPYLAVEAVPHSAAMLRQNIDLNSATNVTVFEGAVIGTDEEFVTISIPDVDRYGAPLGAFVSSEHNVLERRSERSVNVQAINARRLCTGADLIKLDIEGMEYSVLTSLRDYLIASRPTLVVEVLDAASPLKKLLSSLIATCGYQCYAITGQGLIQIDNIMQVRLEKELHTRDVILTTKSDQLDIFP
jgi:FkbM family methyltransferase